ncbi:nucleotidyltransferase domain-containing protein [Methanoplanus sp. FWC-SCC4]|uniref:Nucleotidyltransferase domain-containing protein n=1 Tax=Methanochimaera problematica TaxID=2609417 RepID=A0AA97I4Y1_9EURY|nr:nucleotidyltransferase domain-containing protein [Methanoplanus sp. FWC-SCC4]
MLYGSLARNEMTKNSDIDICISYRGTEKNAGMFRFRVICELSNEKYDIQIFEQLPLYVQIEVLKGKLLYARDESVVYETAEKTIQESEDFKKYYSDYIGLEALS